MIVVVVVVVETPTTIIIIKPADCAYVSIYSGQYKDCPEH